MKRKALALFLFALALASVVTISQDKENALVLLALAVVFALLGVRVWKGKREGSPKTKKKGAAAPSPEGRCAAQAAPEAATAAASGDSSPVAQCESSPQPSSRLADEIVYTTKDGKAYHCYDTCSYIFGRDRISMPRAEAKLHGLHPCKSCFPYGD